MGALWAKLVDRLVADARIMRDAPIAFALCLIVSVALAGIAIWYALDFRYSTQVANANNFNTYLTRQLDDSQKYLQAFPNMKAPGTSPGSISTQSVASAPRNTFTSASGCQYIGGMPYKITAYHNYSRSSLLAAVNDITFKLESLDLERNQKLIAAASIQSDTTSDDAVAKRTQAIEEEEGKIRVKFQPILLSSVRPMWDELHTRLKQRYPISEDDGVDADAMLAYCSGFVTGEHPFATLSSYLKSLAARLPT